jgi:hypothetical protein
VGNWNCIKCRMELEAAIKKYQNNLLSTAEIIRELIEIAREVRESDRSDTKASRFVKSFSYNPPTLTFSPFQT